MLFGDKREDTRTIFFEAWRKYQNKLKLEPQEQRIVNVILAHPEYQKILSHSEKTLEKDYFAELGETNPFLHMGLHLTIVDQVSLDQPKGIRKLYKQALEVFGAPHEAEHCLANSLAIEMHEVMQNAQNFNEKAYMKRIKKYLKQGSW